MKPIRFLLVLVAMTAALLFTTGCNLQESLDTQQALIQQLQGERHQLQANLERATVAVTAVNKQTDDLKQREDFIRQTIAQVSQQLATATGPAFEALERTLDNLRQQRLALQDQVQASAAQAASYATLQADVSAQLAQTDKALADGQAQLDALKTEMQGKIDDVGVLITQVGDALQDHGVPGAAPISKTTANIWGTIAGVLGFGGMLLFGKRSRASDRAANEIAESIQLAKNQNIIFKQAFDQVGDLLKGYQGQEAQAVVQRAKTLIPS